MASIINFDADLYSSTICALNFAKPVIDQHTILIFDEFIMNENWEQDEYRALEEFCDENNYNYEVLAFHFLQNKLQFNNWCLIGQMELTLDQALQKGIEAHKAGKVEEADQYYTAILKANPKHPDANHNMGVLAVGVGKVETALPFFKDCIRS